MPSDVMPVAKQAKEATDIEMQRAPTRAGAPSTRGEVHMSRPISAVMAESVPAMRARLKISCDHATEELACHQWCAGRAASAEGGKGAEGRAVQGEPVLSKNNNSWQLMATHGNSLHAFLGDF